MPRLSSYAERNRCLLVYQSVGHLELVSAESDVVVEMMLIQRPRSKGQGNRMNGGLGDTLLKNSEKVS